MKPERMLVTTAARGRKKSVVWDTSTPVGLGHPFRWILERTPDGVLVRNLGGMAPGAAPDKSVRVGEQQLEGHTVIELPEIKIQLQPVKPIRPAYANESVTGRPERMPNLMAFSGVRRTLIGCQSIHSAFVAYARGRPVFTVYHNNEGFRIKPLLNGVRLKLKGQKSVSGSQGQAWQLTKEQLFKATVVRGWYWWRFSLIQAPAQIDEWVPNQLEDKAFVRRSAIGLLLAMLLLGTATFFWPKPEVKPTEVRQDQVVRFVPRRPIQKVEQLRPEEKPVVQTETVKPVPEPPKPVETKPVADKPKTQEKIPEKTPDPVKPQITKPEKKIAKSPDAPAPKGKTKEEIAQAHAQKKANDVRAALGGIRALLGKDVKEVGRAGGAVDPSGGLDMFKGGDTKVKPTEVKAGAIAVSAKVGAMGGGRPNGVGGSKSDGVGYASGEKAAVSGQGSTFVPVDPGGIMVDEGLTKEEVGQVIHNHMGEIRYCHEQAMLYNPKVEGKLMLQFSIDPRGKIKSTSIQSSTITERQLEECVIGKLKTWQFPKPKGGITVTVGYPFLFKTLGRE